MKYLLLIMLLAGPALAENPDVPDAAFALDMGLGTNFGDDLEQSAIRLEILMPISDRFTVTAKAENRRFELRQYRDSLWKFEDRSTFWEVGCRIYIGDGGK